ncbi:hypothetical protein AAEH85_21385, partial [Shewanella algae]|uniref:hypothetical protein n=1 Tax=Shewanella algae TaxID=38313 RepID=UPI00313D4342
MAAPYPLWWQRPATAALLALLLAPSACVDTRHHYPSLAPRPAEQRDDVEPVRPHPPLIADPALDRQIVEDERTLAAITARFDPLGTR